MNPEISLMLRIEKEMQDRRPVYMPRRNEPENVEPARQLERNNLVKRIFDLIRRQQPCECS